MTESEIKDLIEIAKERHEMNPKCKIYRQTLYSCPDPLCREANRILNLNPTHEYGRKVG